MTLDDLLLNINNADYASLICQTAVQTQEDLSALQEKGYQVSLTEQAFREKTSIDPSCIWYTPSISHSCLYLNQETFAAAPFHMELFSAGLYSGDSLFRMIDEREKEVANNDFYSSVSTLPDGMRMEYFNRLVQEKGAFPGLYPLFFTTYLHSDYGFGAIDSETISAILASKSDSEKAQTADKLQSLPPVVKVYRGGNSASTPAERAYSWSLDINIANFFACRRGIGAGYITEAEVRKEDILEAFLEDRNEQEIIARPQDIHILQTHPVKGLDTIGPMLSTLAPMYHKYLSQMRDLDFSQTADAHGPEHAARVLLLTLTLAELQGLSARDRKVLATAAIFHDTCRPDDREDITHGSAAKTYYQSVSASPDPFVSFLCEYHCRPDAEGYHEIINNRALSKDRTRARRLFDTFKDADALDRVRFGLNNLDLHQLRFPVSKSLSLAARLYHENVKLPPDFLERKPSLSSRVQKASARSAQVKSHPGIYTPVR